MNHRWILRGRQVVLLLGLLGLVVQPSWGQEASVTDLSGAQPDAIELDDIQDALSGSRQTRLVATAPPTVRLPIYFEVNSARLEPTSRELLSRVSTALNGEELESYRFSIEGHTDSVGPSEYNDRLSEERALAVKSFLTVQGGVSPERLSPVGYGEAAPVASNDTADGRRRNRRVEIANLGKAKK